MSRRPAALTLALAAALLGAPAAGRPGTGPGAGALGAQVPPAARWRTIRTPHFRVSYTPGLDSLARHTGAVAERAYARLSRDLTRPPAGTIDLVLADNVDYSNGLTTPFPDDHIYLYARPPVGEPELAGFPDWLELLVDHELTHAFHLDRTSPTGAAVRRVFGRVPMGWPIFPAVGTPNWNLEGMAVFYESHLTGQGRIYGSYHDMVLRTATLEGGLWPIDRLTGESPIWPGGDAAYVYGSLFIDWLGQRYGAGVERRIVDATAAQWLPDFGSVARRATGESWATLYREWQAALRARYAPVADAVRDRGLSRPEVLTRAGYYALFPRVSPDSRQVAFAAQDPKSAAETRVYDVATGRVRRASRRNSLGPAAWLPDGRLLTAQLEWTDRYRLFSDLYSQAPGGGESRLTRHARLEQVDVSRDGRSALALQDSAGLTRLVARDMASGDVSPVTRFDATRYWAFPRWSPDGRRIAAARWSRAGDWDVVVLDPAGDVLAEITRDRAVDSAPAWSPDGRWLLWESDRTGIPNIFAADVSGAGTGGGAPVPLLQVTNVLGGAFYPDVSPDGRWLYFAGYHADGFHLERVPFEPARWAAPGSARASSPDSIGVFAQVAADTMAGPPRRYSPLATLRPHYWAPTLYTQARRDFVGASTTGADVVNRHAYALAAAYDPRRGDAAWSAGWSWAGLGDPLLQLSTSRSYDTFTAVSSTALYDGVRREDDFAAAAAFLRPRARSSLALTLGGDLALRKRWLDNAPANVPLLRPNDRLTGVFGAIGFADYQVFPYSISREDGVALSLAGRRRWGGGVAGAGDVGYSEATTSLRGYRSLPLPGFAHHVLALRASALWRAGTGAEPADIGGISGQQLDLGLVSAGTAGVFLPVRGYPEGVRSGTRAWTASLEYRAPLALVGRGWGTRPYYLDRLSADAFADAGNAWCPNVDAHGRTPGGFGCTASGLRPLVGAGAELVADARLLIPVTLRFRAGAGFPVSEGGPARGWVTLGSSF